MFRKHIIYFLILVHEKITYRRQTLDIKSTNCIIYHNTVSVYKKEYKHV